jgi:dienelactone hydrolase
LHGTSLGLPLLFWLGGDEAQAAAEPSSPDASAAGSRSPRRRSDPPAIHSSWDDLLEGISSAADWEQRRRVLRRRYLELIRDAHKPPRPPLDMKIHETVDVDGRYTRLRASYNVEAGERAHAYIGIPRHLSGKVPGIVALHGTHQHGARIAAGLFDSPADRDRAYLDHLARRGFVVIAPEHFVSGERTPPEGAYDTARFYARHPEWTAVGKFTFEHSIAIDVLQSLEQVDGSRIGAMGHSLGGHGTFFLSAYDDRVQAAACNCGATFFRHCRTVEAWSRDRWYVYFKHIRPRLLAGELPPIDMHEIIALIAPRAFLEVSGFNDGDPLTQRQRVLMNMKIADVYALLGAPGQFAFASHGRGHSIESEWRALIYTFLENRLKTA